MSLDLQILTQLPIVVDLSVKRNDPAPVRRRHGLIAALEVDDRQTPESHCDSAVNILAASVRSAVDDPVHHIGQDLTPALRVLRLACDLHFHCIRSTILLCRFFIFPGCPSRNVTGKSANSTHKICLLFFQMT